MMINHLNCKIFLFHYVEGESIPCMTNIEESRQVESSLTQISET